MLIKWTRTAENEFIAILEWYQKQENTVLAQSIAQKIWERTQRLASFPLSAPLGLIPNTRELIFPDILYFIVYEVSDAVYILRILHTARIYPA